MFAGVPPAESGTGAQAPRYAGTHVHVPQLPESTQQKSPKDFVGGLTHLDHNNFGPGMLLKYDNLVCMGQGVVLF